MLFPLVVNSIVQVSWVFSMNFMPSWGILYILRQCTIQLWGTISLAFLESIQAIARFFRRVFRLVDYYYYYYYYYYYTPCKFFTPALPDCLSLESEWQRVFLRLLHPVIRSITTVIQYIQMQADSVVSDTKRFINFWRRSMATRGERHNS